MTSLIRVALFALSFSYIVARADEKPPTWSLSQSASAQLADKVDVGWFSLQPPKGYERADLANASAFASVGIKIAVWTLDTDNPIKPAITVMSFPAQDQRNGDTNEIFDGIMDSLTAKWPDAQRSKVSTGTWNGETSYRCQFSASHDGYKLQGGILAQVLETTTFVVSVIHPVESDADRNALKTLVFAALSCKLN